MSPISSFSLRGDKARLPHRYLKKIVKAGDHQQHIIYCIKATKMLLDQKGMGRKELYFIAFNFKFLLYLL